MKKSHFLPVRPLLLVLESGRKPLWHPEGPSAAPDPLSAAASGSPAPAPCNDKRHFKNQTVEQNKRRLNQRSHAVNLKAITGGLTVPRPQAHAVSHSVSQGDSYLGFELQPSDPRILGTDRLF